MKKRKFRIISDLAYFSSVGISLAFSIFIGLFIGVYLDGKFDTSPVLTFIFLGLGIAAGFRNLLMAINKFNKL